MFSRWIWNIFNIQIQSDRGHKLMLFMFQNKDKDLLGIYQYGCDPFCVSLLTDIWSFQNVFALDSSHFHSLNSKWIRAQFVYFIFQNKDEDLLGIYQYGYDPFMILRVFANWKAFKSSLSHWFCLDFQTKVRLCLRLTRSITRCTQKVRSWHSTLRLQILMFWAW